MGWESGILFSPVWAEKRDGLAKDLQWLGVSTGKDPGSSGSWGCLLLAIGSQLGW